MDRSFSQLSISQRSTKRKKSSVTRHNQSVNNNNSNELLKGINENNNQTNTKRKKQVDYNESFAMNCMQKFKPDYLKVSDNQFKQMLLNATPDNDIIVRALNTHEKLQFVRQMTEVTNDLYYFDLQRQLWQEYYNMSLKEDSMKTVVEQRRLSKSDAKLLHTCHKYNLPKQAIEKRQQRIAHQIQRLTNELNGYRMKLNTWTTTTTTTTTTQCPPVFDPNILSNAIDGCVRKGQQRLRQEFDYKKKMLELNAIDHHLIHKVYDLQPTEEQVRVDTNRNKI